MENQKLKRHQKSFWWIGRLFNMSFSDDFIVYPPDFETKYKFRVYPNFLEKETCIPDPVKVKIIAPDSIFVAGMILNEREIKIVRDGGPFILTKTFAENLISNGDAVRLE